MIRCGEKTVIAPNGAVGACGDDFLSGLEKVLSDSRHCGIATQDEQAVRSVMSRERAGTYRALCGLVESQRLIFRPRATTAPGLGRCLRTTIRRRR